MGKLHAVGEGGGRRQRIYGKHTSIDRSVDQRERDDLSLSLGRTTERQFESRRVSFEVV